MLQKRWISSATLNAILFFFFFFICSPSYRSGDDVFLLYLMGGGFGDAPTELLHYNNGMHPFLGLLLKYLFAVCNEINWYTILLYSFHFVCTTILLRLLLERHAKIKAIVGFCLFFFFFETNFLLTPTFTNTAAIGGIVSCCWILDYSRKKVDSKYYLSPLILLIFSSLFRVHILIPVLFVLLPLFFTGNVIGEWKKITGVFAISGVLFFSLNTFHQFYYENHIPNWPKTEVFRQAYFKYINNPAYKLNGVGANYDIECTLLSNGLLIDKEFLSAEKINEICRRPPATKNFFSENIGIFLYWSVRAFALFLLELVLVTVFIFFNSPKEYRRALFATALLILGISSYLFLFFKLPGYMFACLTSSAVAGFFVIFKFNNEFRGRQVFVAISLLLLFWNANRLRKINNSNLEAQKRFEICQKEINSRPDKLFVMLSDVFPFEGFSVWNVPIKYRIVNILYKDILLNGDENKVLIRFGLHKLTELWNNNNVLFWGRQTTHVENYCEKVLQHKLNFSNPLPGFTYSEIRQASFK